MTLNVVGAGFGRTGTDSMRKALNILGVGPTFHAFELGDGSPLKKPWLEMIKGADPDWEALFSGYNSCVDWPAAFYWRTLAQAYPQAKVVLTMRSAESWWASFENTILKHILSKKDMHGFAHHLIAEQVFEGRPDDRNHAIALYNRNIEEVMDTVDSERLLVHNLGDGWEPLCQLLERPIPDLDYPSGNTPQEFHERI